MNYSKEAGYGSQVAHNLPFGITGKVFVVGKSALAYRDMYNDVFTPDNDGRVRFAATIAAAVALCTANAGDQILVLPGHTESVASAAALAINIAGVNIVGLGAGSNRPTITFTTATTATMTITAANVSISNFIFTQTFDAIVSPIVISGASCTLKNNYFMVADGTYQATQMILTTAGASNLVIDSNRFIGTVDAGSTCAVTLVGGDSIKISNNYFTGAYTTTVGGIQCITTLTTNIEISNNIIINRTASSAKAITLLTGSTGMITNNRLGILTGTVPIASDAAYWSGNYYAAAVATAGTLV